MLEMSFYTDLIVEGNAAMTHTLFLENAGKGEAVMMGLWFVDLSMRKCLRRSGH